MGKSVFNPGSDESGQDAAIVALQLVIAALSGSSAVRFGLSCHTLKFVEILTKPLIRDTLKSCTGRCKATMENAKIEFPEVVGKSVIELSILEDEPFGREFLVRFSDGTQLSVCVGVKQAIDARYCKEDTPDTPIFTREG